MHTFECQFRSIRSTNHIHFQCTNLVEWPQSETTIREKSLNQIHTIPQSHILPSTVSTYNIAKWLFFLSFYSQCTHKTYHIKRFLYLRSVDILYSVVRASLFLSSHTMFEIHLNIFLTPRKTIFQFMSVIWSVDLFLFCSLVFHFSSFISKKKKNYGNACISQSSSKLSFTDSIKCAENIHISTIYVVSYGFRLKCGRIVCRMRNSNGLYTILFLRIHRKKRQIYGATVCRECIDILKSLTQFQYIFFVSSQTCTHINIYFDRWSMCSNRIQNRQFTQTHTNIQTSTWWFIFICSIFFHTNDDLAM